MNLLKLIASLSVALAPGIIGGLVTAQNIPTWYDALQKPPLIPPNWIFGPVWTVLYVLIGISLFLVMVSAGKDKQPAYTAYGVQLLLNFLWTVVFFGLQSPWAALVIILALSMAIAWNISESIKLSKAAGYLLVPYLLWVSFATYLNLGVALLN